MRFLVFLFCFVSSQTLFAVAQPLEAEIIVNQVAWSEAEGVLSFDIEMQAVGRSFYLSFSEIVIILPKTRFLATPVFSYLKGTCQLLTLGGESLSYEGIEAVINQRERQTYFVVKILPNQFLDPVDFFDRTALIDSAKGVHRLGRFEIRGISRLGKQIGVRVDDDSPFTVMRAFDPLIDFKAVEVAVKGKPLRFKKIRLNAFEISSNDETLKADWKCSKELAALGWRLMVSADRKEWMVVAAGIGGFNAEVSLNTFAGNLQAREIAVKLVWMGKGQAFESPVRLITFR